MKPTISLCMLLKNEGQLLEQCLKSVRDVVDEIIVVIDTKSTDQTGAIAKRFGARIFYDNWDGNFGRARNVYLKYARSSWILVLDGDERIAKKDLVQLRKLIKDPKTLGFRLICRDYSKTHNLIFDWHPRNNQYPGEERFSQCPGWSQYKVLRLFRNQKGIHYEEAPSVHAKLTLESFRNNGSQIIRDSNIVIHNFQYLKGGGKFIHGKQKARLKAEIKHSRAFSGSFHSHFNVAKTFFSLHKDFQAIAYLKKAIKANPKHEPAHRLLGIIYKEQRKFQKSVLYLKEAIHLNPNNADNWAIVGMVYETWGRFDKAEEALKKAIRLRRLHPLAHNSLGIAYQNQEKFSLAEKAYQKAIRNHKEHPDAYYNLATLYEVQNKFKKAGKFYARAIAVDPLDTESKSRLAALKSRS